MSQCLIFCRTNFDCDNVETFLNQCGGGGKFRGKAESGPENPYSCVVLGGSRSMDERRRNLAAFKEGDVRFLICTDVAARGLDVKGLPFVINVTLPDKSEDYVHRIGRVGRADTMGLAISIVAACQERVWYCQKKGHKPWFDPSRTGFSSTLCLVRRAAAVEGHRSADQDARRADRSGHLGVTERAARQAGTRKDGGGGGCCIDRRVREEQGE